jgi:ferric-dicitrate binding protein FerR (iron transport regulator)
MNREWERLFGALRDGIISPDEMDHLERLVATDPAAQQAYLEYMEICATLRHYEVLPCSDAARAPGIAEKSCALPRVSSARERWWPIWRAAAVLAFAVGLGSAGFVLMRHREGPVHVSVVRPVPAPATMEVVAVITKAVRESWNGAVPRVGLPLVPGRFQLRSGIVRVEFSTGAIMVVKGPADFELASASRVRWRHGALRAWVPPAAAGFTVASSTVELVDRGTGFGFRVDPAGNAEVHVFEGHVELHPTLPGQKLDAKPDLLQGDGVRVAPGGACSAIPANPEEFGEAADLLGRTPAR